MRNPLDPTRDAYSQLEAAAVDYAHRRGVVVVAAVGNGNVAPRQPWPFASYPAALPHVLGVSALARDGSAPAFSNRDKIYNDIAAPGQGILSTLPRGLTAQFRDCDEQGYSSCGPLDYRSAYGTSFAAPQVSAAAAVLLAERPSLRPDQVTALLTRTARRRQRGHRLLALPARARRAHRLGSARRDRGPARARRRAAPAATASSRTTTPGRRRCGSAARSSGVVATLDFWDDQNDVYAIKLRRGQPVYISVRGPAETDTNLILWKPEARRVEDIRSARPHRQAVRASRRARESRVPGAAHGWHFVQVKLGSSGSGRYKLVIVKA